MSTADVLIIMLTIIGTAIVAVLFTVAMSSLVRAHRMRLEPSLGDARQAIVEALSGGGAESDHAVAVLSGFASRHVTSVMLELVPSVTGTSRDVLVALGERTGVLPRVRDGLHRRRWSTRLYSIRVLSAFGVATEEMCGLLTDRSPEVRGQAASWAVVAPSVEVLAGLIALLSDPDGLCRFAAQDALVRIGLVGSEALISALETPKDEDAARRMLEVAAAMGDERFYEKAIQFTANASPDTRALAVAVLARTGSPSAGPALVKLLDDSSEDVIRAAAVGIAKLSYWPGGAAVEPFLGHPSWELRKQAGLTLLALGAPGEILLRSVAPGLGLSGEMAFRALQLQSISIQGALA
jgi:HEAT repeats